MVSLWDCSSLPTIVTPSEEAGISIEDHEPPVKDETNKFKLESINIYPDLNWKEYNIEKPDEHPGAIETEGEEDSIPDPIKQEVNELVNEHQ